VFSKQNNDHLPSYDRIDFSTAIQLNKDPEGFQHTLSFALFNMFGNENPIFLYFNKTVDNEGKLVVPADRLNTADLTTSIRYTFIVIPSITYQFVF
jgi:hypothetical protein